MNHKQALPNINKDLTNVKTQFFKLKTKNKHLLVKSVEVEKVIKKVEALQSKYNELTHAHFKTCNDLKTLQTNLDRLTRDYGKMEAINVQWEKTLLELENTCLQQREQLTKVNIDMENRTHELWVQIQELKGELETFCKVCKVFQTNYMDNQLKGFEELLFDNALLKVHNQTLADKNPKWEEWWQTVHEIIKKQILNSLEIVHVDEEAYLNERIAYWLHFEGYKYDQLTSKLVEVPIIIFQKFSLVQAATIVISS